MSNRRRLIIALGAGALVAPFGSFAQPHPVKVYRIGILGAEGSSVQANRVEAVKAGLRDFGYVEGRNLVTEFRWADGNYERLPDFATELVRLKVDVVVAFGQKAADAAKHATTTIPIVVPFSTDAVGSGFAVSLARPGGNMTGFTSFGPEMMAKRLEILKEAVPRITQVAVLLNPADSGSRLMLQAMEAATNSLKLSLQPFEVRTPNEFESIFSVMVKRRVDAIVVSGDTLFAANLKIIADLAAKNRLPSASLFKEFAEFGGLISYGPNLLDLYRRAAVFVDKIFKGAKPSDLPFEQPTMFEMVINLKTAKALGVKIPNSILVRATKVIE